MNHLGEDTLLKSVLKLLDDQDEKIVHRHLLECPECSLSFKNIEDQTQIIGEYQPEIEETFYPLPKEKSIPFGTVMRVAFVLIIGFLFGFFTSEYISNGYINIEEQHLISMSPTTSIFKYHPCEQIDIWISP